MIWIGVVVYAYAALQTARDFLIMGAVLGIVLGGSQALSRALFSRMIPPGQEAEFFSIYEVSDKGTTWLGPLLFGLAYDLTKSYRVAILSVATFLILGLLLLLFVNVGKAGNVQGRKLAGGNVFAQFGQREIWHEDLYRGGVKTPPGSIFPD